MRPVRGVENETAEYSPTILYYACPIGLGPVKAAPVHTTRKYVFPMQQ